MPEVRHFVLGDSQVGVSRLCFGTAFMGYQADNMSPSEGSDLLLYALERGVRFWDTSDDYGTHEHVANALSRVSREEVVISTKTKSADAPAGTLLRELGTDYIDILFAHDIGSGHMGEARRVLAACQEDRAKGSVRALGIATHSAVVADIACELPEVEVLMLPINSTGYCVKGIQIEGGVGAMMEAAEKAFSHGKGVVAMKIMGCGTLAGDPGSAISYVNNLHYVHSLCIGMRSAAEVDQNVRLLTESAL
jgi:aryl-alcohol dehydrogenase-like predicted oxidoreductase